jgi:His-Xaa-Ser system protein HxsD
VNPAAPSPASSPYPEGLVTIDAEGASVAIRLDASLYPIGAVYAAAYVFLDRCYLLVDRPDSSHHVVTLSWKKTPGDGAGLERLAGDFANECLSCAWRGKIAEEGRAVIEATTARALAGAMGPPTLDDLESFDFGAAPFDDPLGIAMSWEDKYGKKKDKGVDKNADKDADKDADAGDKHDGDAKSGGAS